MTDKSKLRRERLAALEGQIQKQRDHSRRRKQLFKAAREYVEANHGKVTSVESAAIREWPGEPGNVFWVCIKCVGDKPDFNRK